MVEATGHVGCVKSSARYKRNIRDMGDASDKLMMLRPVTFHYKEDSTGTEQYGLIAEEVEKIYPELVIDDTDGGAETVAYQVLPAMLLNEVQKGCSDRDYAAAAGGVAEEKQRNRRAGRTSWRAGASGSRVTARPSSGRAALTISGKPRERTEAARIY